MRIAFWIGTLSCALGCGEVRVPPPGELVLALSSSSATMRQGGTVSVQITATRGPTAVGPIVIETTNLPSGVTAQALPLEGDIGTLMVSALPSATQGGPIAVHVKGSVGYITGTADLQLLVMGSAGTLDNSFGAGGKAFVDFAMRRDETSALAVSADGKIAIAGNSTDPTVLSLNTVLLFERFTPSGGPDLTFDGDGQVTHDLANMRDQAVYQVLFQPDGKLLFCGERNAAGNSDFMVGRLYADGSLDTTFSDGGYQVRDFAGYEDYARAIALQSDQKIVIAGAAGASNSSAMIVMRLLPADGAPDPSFGTAGVVRLPALGTGMSDSAWAIAIDEDGTIILAGSAAGTSAYDDVAVVRLTQAGALDPTFGTGGKVIWDASSPDSTSPGDAARSVAIAPDHSIVLGGYANRLATKSDYLVMRLFPNGNLDMSFADAGLFLLDWFGDNDQANDIAIGDDGSIAVVGFARENASSNDNGLVRLTQQGALDPSFGQGGKSLIDLVVAGSDSASQVVLQPDGRWIVSGLACNRGCDGSVIRVWP